MVSFTSLVLLGLAAVGTLAAPAEKRWSNSQCMTSAEAQQVADNYAELIRNYSTELANEALTPDFTDYSESVNSLINTCPQGKAAKAKSVPLMAAAFSNRQKFETGQGQQPPINFKQLNLESNCNFLTLRWETTNTAKIPHPRPVVGIILIEVEKAPSGSKFPWLVHTVYSEFDSAAWLQNLEQWGICGTPNADSPTLALPSGTPGTPPASSAPAPTGSAAPTSYVQPASATTTPASSAAASSYNNGQWTTSTSASSATASSYNNGQWTPSTSASSVAATYSA